MQTIHICLYNQAVQWIAGLCEEALVVSLSPFYFPVFSFIQNRNNLTPPDGGGIEFTLVIQPASGPAQAQQMKRTMLARTNQWQLRAGPGDIIVSVGDHCIRRRSLRLLHFRIFQRLKIKISSSMLDNSKRKHYLHIQHSEEVLKSVKHRLMLSGVY